MADLNALITGSSSGIGLAIAKHLLESLPELQIVGLSRRPGALEENPRFTHWKSELGDPDIAFKRGRRYLQEKQECNLLVHAAGAGLFKPSFEWSTQDLVSLTNLNLVSPMALTGCLTQRLRKSRGLVVFIGSTSSQERAPLGAAYSATKAGLHHFSENYFQENRKHGVRTLHLCCGMTDTEFYDKEKFAPKHGEEFSVQLTAIAELVSFFFQGPGKNSNPSHLVLEPQKVGIRKKNASQECPMQEF